MNVATMTMPVEQARVKLKAYRAQIHRRADAEYEAAAKGYEAMAQGKRLIDLHTVFRETGWDAKGRPKLAIARADRRNVELSVGTHQIQFNAGSRNVSQRAGSNLIVSIPTAVMPDHPYKTEVWKMGRAQSVVPMVPADVRPNVNLADCFILWEAAWLPVPDRDPFLLKHIHGTLYAVLAEWDLTELERAIIAGRRA